MYVIIYEDEEKWTELIYKNIKPMYEISTYGNIRNKITGKLLSTHVDPKKGYYMVSLMVLLDNGYSDQKTFKVHKLVAHTFLVKPSVPNGTYLTVNHKKVDKNKLKSDNSIYNLEWKSFKDNIRHSFTEGLNKPLLGMKNGNNKYDESVIRYICKEIAKGEKGRNIKKRIEKEFSIKITRYLISDIKHKKSWVHISNEYF